MFLILAAKKNGPSIWIWEAKWEESMIYTKNVSIEGFYDPHIFSFHIRI
jgi:hypothetical protein